MSKLISCLLLILTLQNIANADWFWESADDSKVLSELTPASDALSVLWWNIGEGAFDSVLYPTYGKHVLNENLLEIARSAQSPDLLILGEFVKSGVGDEEVAALEKIYPYTANFLYNSKGSPRSVQVFSKLVIAETHVLDAIDWGPMDKNSDEAKAFKQKWIQQYSGSDDHFTRSFQSVQIEKNGKRYHVIPTHIAEPWNVIKNLFGEARMGQEMLFGKDNPYYYSVLHFKETLKIFMSRISVEDSLIYLGDFNISSKFMGFTPVGYKTLLSGFTDLTLENATFTFPATSISSLSNYPKVNLDHGFVVSAKQGVHSVSPRLIGSDHYPIWIMIR